MKTHSWFALLLLLCWRSEAQVASPMADPQNFQIVERGRDYDVWQRVTQQTLGDGSVVLRTNSYTSLGTGIHYWKDGAWRDTNPRFTLFPGGAVAEEGPFQLIVAPDVATEGTIDLLTPDAKRFVSSPRWLAYYNLVTGDSAIIAAVKSCPGQLVEPNVVLFADAFDDIHASIRYTYMPRGVEQEIILLEPISPREWGLQGEPGDIVLEMWSEFLTWPEPEKTTTWAQDGMNDVKLEFGQATIGPGKAFSLVDEDHPAQVMKTWTKIDRRQFLIEAVRQSELAQLFVNLPKGAHARNPAKAVRGLAQRKASAGRAGLLAQGNKRLKAREKPAQTASIGRAGNGPGTGVVIDYSIVTTTSNYRFKSDSTYFITNSIQLSGTTIIEGGAVVKFDYFTNGAWLAFTGPVDCRTSAYRASTFTGKDDDSVGEIISGSTGSPGTNRYAVRAVDLAGLPGSTYDIHDLHIRYANKAIAASASSMISTVSHCQIGFVDYAIYTPFSNNKVFLRNLLVYDALRGIYNGTTTTNRSEHLTFHRVGDFRHLNATNGAVYLTNSLLICVTNNVAWTGSNVETNLDDAQVFRTVGSGAHYLAAQSSYHGAGTTNVALLADLKNRTTCAPVVLASDITNDTLLSAQAGRSYGSPDLGYHYDPLDFIVSQIAVTNASLTLQMGTALGVYGAASNYGLVLLDGARIVSEGSPTNLNRIVRYNLVQEQANTNWSAPTVGRSVGTPSTYATNLLSSEARFRFTQWSMPAAGNDHLYAGATNLALSFQDCQFGGGQLTAVQPNITVLNSLFDRVQLTLSANANPFTALVRNCTMAGGTVTLQNNAGGVWALTNNLFDTTNIIQTGSVSNNYNGYLTNSARLTPNGANDVLLTVTGITYDTGQLGRFYLPTNLTSQAPLFDGGGLNATNVGLWNFTTMTNQLKETNSVVDIGYHSVALATSGLPIDTDADGLPDYQEDRDGNGAKDTGESDWQSADTDGDGVNDYLEYLLGRNQLVAGATNDVNGVINFRLYTPLK